MEKDVNAAAVRLGRTLKLAFIGSGLLFIFLVIRLPAKSPHSAPPAIELVMTIVAFACVFAGFFVPRVVRRAQPFQDRPGSTALNQWMSMTVLSLAFFQACILFGFVLHLVGARAPFVDVLLAAGIISLLIWSPQPPPASNAIPPPIQ